jgi:CheY-like chemotaxis protein
LDTNLGLRILCIEDDVDTCEVIVELLRREGYEVSSATTAEQAMKELRGASFQLVISDYMLPDELGSALIQRARAEGVLKRETPVLIFTAHPSPERPEGTMVLRKPLAVDMFLRTVYDILAPAREAEMEKAKQTVMERFHEPSDSVRAELILYVSAASPASLRALRNMEELLAAHVPGQVKFEVVDLSKESPASVDEDRIAFTPTLVQRRPDPRTWILGDLHNIQVVADLLAYAGVEKKK